MEQALEQFERIHFVKVKLSKEEGKYDIVDNFNTISFTATIPNDVVNEVTIMDLEGSALFRITQESHNEYTVTSRFGETIGLIRLNSVESEEGLNLVTILDTNKAICLKVTKIPLIEKTNEFHVSSMELNEVIGRINVARSKAIISVQPELRSKHKIRIISTSLVLLGFYNNAW